MPIAASVVLVVTGCIVAGFGDLTFDLGGYIYCLLSTGCQAAYMLLVEIKGSDGATSSQLLYFNSITALPLLLLIVASTGEAAALPGAVAVVGGA